MNRPTILNYEFVKDKFESKYNYKLFTKELEAYCDELERKLSGHDILVEFADDLLADYKELNKAFDKACWCIVNNIDFLKNTKKTEEEWKDWFKEDWY